MGGLTTETQRTRRGGRKEGEEKNGIHHRDTETQRSQRKNNFLRREKIKRFHAGNFFPPSI